MPGAGGDGALVFNGDRASVWEDENIQQMDGGDVRRAALMCLMPLEVRLETVKMLDFTPCLFTTNQTKIKIQDANAYTAEFLKRSKVAAAESPEPRGAQKRALRDSYRPTWE